MRIARERPNIGPENIPDAPDFAENLAPGRFAAKGANGIFIPPLNKPDDDIGDQE